ncbi:hypothetical protein ASPSYDRAFT_1028061 [Aspergillus sydowii CBS 593.65]|uniref:Secreted protein n=1 Tax=Aspergillus sydowii CBS 593.65 TaxID=1036612 RepID=A0A1L9TFG1_9EURO|nr:uncharacterized protein ASPSYDRAFT_1028061 [Aspergillus sydowii CBS 593.65]OJJ58111.1 hypothetical protein ASPSYDRAFT_1028061 [Aspergillus sydowii CBS 593.65]
MVFQTLVFCITLLVCYAHMSITDQQERAKNAAPLGFGEKASTRSLGSGADLLQRRRDQSRRDNSGRTAASINRYSFSGNENKPRLKISRPYHRRVRQLSGGAAFRKNQTMEPHPSFPPQRTNQGPQTFVARNGINRRPAPCTRNNDA